MRAFNVRAELADGRVLSARTSLRDQTRWEDTARKHKWGTQFENFGLWEAFLTWSALDRAGDYTLGWDAFVDACVQIESTAVPVPPTDAVPSAASTST